MPEMSARKDLPARFIGLRKSGPEAALPIDEGPLDNAGTPVVCNPAIGNAGKAGDFGIPQESMDFCRPMKRAGKPFLAGMSGIHNLLRIQKHTEPK